MGLEDEWADELMRTAPMAAAQEHASALRPLPAGPPGSPRDAEGQPTPKLAKGALSMWQLQAGTKVVLHGLVNRPALNGEHAVIQSLVEEIGRWAVKLVGSGEAITVKGENMNKSIFQDW